MSRIKSSARKIGKESKGFDLETIVSKPLQSEAPASSKRVFESSGLTLVDCHTLLANATKGFLEAADKEFEKGLRELKKDRRTLKSGYDSILRYLRTILKSYLNEHSFVQSKLVEICRDSFEVTLEPSNPKASQEINPSLKHIHQKMPLNVFIYRILLLKEDKLSFGEAGIALRGDRRWSVVQPRLEAHLVTLIRLAETLGVDIELLKSKFRDSTRRFTEKYLESIDMLEHYFRNEENCSIENRESMSTATLYFFSKSRTFVLYLFVRYVNEQLPGRPKVRFNDNLNLRYPKEDRFGMEINKRTGSEDPLTHFDVYPLRNGQPAARISCEPG
jgi:hypothetical protein